MNATYRAISGRLKGRNLMLTQCCISDERAYHSLECPSINAIDLGRASWWQVTVALSCIWQCLLACIFVKSP